jgi:hypothetical protein
MAAYDRAAYRSLSSSFHCPKPDKAAECQRFQSNKLCLLVGKCANLGTAAVELYLSFLYSVCQMDEKQNIASNLVKPQHCGRTTSTAFKLDYHEIC